LIHVGVVSTEISPLKCGKLNVRSFVPTFAPNITTLRIFGSDNVIVPIVNKYGFVAKSIYSSLSMTPSIRS
jgi:hypothetical protein